MDRKFKFPYSEDKTETSCYFLGGRTWEQFMVAKEITERPDLEYFKSNLKALFAPSESGPVSIVYQTNEGNAKRVRVGTTGKILRETKLASA